MQLEVPPLVSVDLDPHRFTPLGYVITLARHRSSLGLCYSECSVRTTLWVPPEDIWNLRPHQHLLSPNLPFRKISHRAALTLRLLICKAGGCEKSRGSLTQRVQHGEGLGQCSRKGAVVNMINKERSQGAGSGGTG